MSITLEPGFVFLAFQIVVPALFLQAQPIHQHFHQHAGFGNALRLVHKLEHGTQDEHLIDPHEGFGRGWRMLRELLLQQVADALVIDKAMAVEAHRLGLQVTDDELRAMFADLHLIPRDALERLPMPPDTTLLGGWLPDGSERSRDIHPTILDGAGAAPVAST